jgi:hypothetical protein
MSQPKRSRGRPKGSQIDDRELLLRVAERIVANPSLRPTSALKLVHPRPKESLIRRFQFKWRMWGEQLLAEVRDRVAPRPVVASSSPVGRRLSAIELARRIADSPVLRMARAWDDSPAMKLARKYQDGTVFRLARIGQDSPFLHKMAAMQASPLVKKMIEIQTSPAVQKMIELQRSPTFQKMVEFQNSPAMRAIRERQEMLARLGL